MCKGAGKPLSDNTLGMALRTADIPATIHGNASQPPRLARSRPAVAVLPTNPQTSDYDGLQFLATTS